MPTLWKKIDFFGNDVVVRLGDTVWFFPGCSMTSTPQCGTITLLSEDNMIDIAIQNVNLLRRVSEQGVCLYGSDKLSNPVHKNKGCWMPRTDVNVILASPDRQG